MKTKPHPTVSFILALALASAVQVEAYDPVGPPPEKTIGWTTGYLSKVIVPRVNFDGTAPLEECLDFLEVVLGAPAAYGIEIDGKALGDAKLGTLISLNERDLKLLEILARLADAVDADLIIERGKVSLIPKK